MARSFMGYSMGTQKLLREFDVDVCAYMTGYTGAIALEVGYNSPMPVETLVFVAMGVFFVAVGLGSRTEHMFEECGNDSELVR